MKIKSLFGLIILFFMRTSCIESLPNDIIQPIAQNFDIKDMCNFKLTCKAHNEHAHYWMIDPAVIQKANVSLYTNGLIHFNFHHQTKNFNFFLTNEPEQSATNLTLLELEKEISKKSIKAFNILLNPIALHMVSTVYPGMRDSDGYTVMYE